jgi:hypothetical protein
MKYGLISARQIGSTLPGLFFRNAPPEVYLDEFHLPFPAASPEFGEDELHQFIPFGMHITKGG